MSYTCYLYNNSTGSWETYTLSGTDSMPYANYLQVDEFLVSHTSEVTRFFTDKRAMDGWNAVRSKFNSPITVSGGFVYPWNNPHGKFSQHMAGVAFDTYPYSGNTCSCNTTSYDGTTCGSLYGAALTEENAGYVKYVEPMNAACTHVHFDMRTSSDQSCSNGCVEFATIQEGNSSVYTALLQESLENQGYTVSDSFGVFGASTKSAVEQLQSNKGLSVDGIVGCDTWMSLMDAYKSGC